MAFRGLISKSRDRKEVPEKLLKLPVASNDFDEALIEEDIQEEPSNQNLPNLKLTGNRNYFGEPPNPFLGKTEANAQLQMASDPINMMNPLGNNISTVSQSEDWDKEFRKTNESLSRSKLKSATQSIENFNKNQIRGEKPTSSHYLGERESNQFPEQPKEEEMLLRRVPNIHSSDELLFQDQQGHGMYHSELTGTKNFKKTHSKEIRVTEKVTGGKGTTSQKELEPFGEARRNSTPSQSGGFPQGVASMQMQAFRMKYGNIMKFLDSTEENPEENRRRIEPSFKVGISPLPIGELGLLESDSQIQVAGIERLLLSTKIRIGRVAADILETRAESRSIEFEAEQLVAEQREEEALLRLNDKQQVDRLVDLLEEKHSFLVQNIMSLKMALESLDIVSFLKEYRANFSRKSDGEAKAHNLITLGLRKNEEFFQGTRQKLLRLGSLKSREEILVDPILRADLAQMKYNLKFKKR